MLFDVVRHEVAMEKEKSMNETREFVIEVTFGAYIEDIGQYLRYGERREEIVRCGECELSYKNRDGELCCTWWQDPYEAFDMTVEPDGFCSRGKRREDA